MVHPSTSTSMSSCPLPVNQADEAANWIKATIANLIEIRDGIYKTLRKYFHRITIHLLRCPAFKHLRKAINGLISILESLLAGITESRHIADKDDTAYAIYVARDSIDTVIGQGEEILHVWNRRETGQTPTAPLTGKDRRLRELLIHTSNDRLDNLKERTVRAEHTIQQLQFKETSSVLVPGRD